MKWFAVEIFSIVGIILFARAVMLPLCGRVAIWRSRLFGLNDVVEIGDTRGRVARIGPLRTILESIDVPSVGRHHYETVNNADVFRKTIIIGLSFRDWEELRHAR